MFLCLVFMPIYNNVLRYFERASFQERRNYSNATLYVEITLKTDKQKLIRAKTGRMKYYYEQPKSISSSFHINGGQSKYVVTWSIYCILNSEELCVTNIIHRRSYFSWYFFDFALQSDAIPFIYLLAMRYNLFGHLNISHHITECLFRLWLRVDAKIENK